MASADLIGAQHLKKTRNVLRNVRSRKYRLTSLPGLHRQLVIAAKLGQSRGVYGQTSYVEPSLSLLGPTRRSRLECST